MPAVEMLHSVDPKTAIESRAGDLSSVEVFNNSVLVAIYEQPERTKAGLYLPDRNRAEAEYQGKVGLIVKMGPKAFLDADFDVSERCNVGDWVYFRAADGWPLNINTLKSDTNATTIVKCRMLIDGSIKGRIQHPDSIY